MWAALLVVGVFLLQTAQQPAPPASSPAEQAAQSIDAAKAAQQAALDAQFTHDMATGADLYSNRKFVDAAHSFEQAVNLKPENDQAQFWAGQSLLYARQSNAAIAYLESAGREGGGESVGVHLALAAAYAGAGPSRQADLDRERVLLHKWHDEGTHGNITNQSGFLLETFFARQWHVNVVEYFAPQEGRDILWRFAVRDPAELIEAVYTLERPAAGGTLEKPAAEKPTAGATPAKSATGAAQEWELIGRSRNGSVEDPPKRIKTYATLPTYFEVKAEVMKRMRFRVPEHSSLTK